MGLNLEWEQHQIKDKPSGLNLGTEQTVTILPTIEFHPTGRGRFSPYGLLGLGININSFSNSCDLDTFCVSLSTSCTVSPRTTFALKVGAGVDYFITTNLALNGELDWKLNNGYTDLTGSFPSFGTAPSADNHINSLSFLLGVRYFID